LADCHNLDMKAGEDRGRLNTLAERRKN